VERIEDSATGDPSIRRFDRMSGDSDHLPPLILSRD